MGTLKKEYLGGFFTPHVAKNDSESRLWRTFGRSFILPLTQQIFNPLVEGIEHIPEEPVILAINQTSAFDGPIINSALAYNGQREVAFVSNDGRVLPYGGRIVQSFLKGLGYITLPLQGNYRQAIETLVEGAKKSFEKGRHVGIFPERARVPYERLGKFSIGVTKVAERTGKPIVPIYLNTYRHKMDSVVPVKVGEAIHPEGTENGHTVLLIRRVKEAIQEMSDYPAPCERGRKVRDISQQVDLDRSEMSF